MGHRANFVVIEKDEARAYYDRWAAMDCVYAFAAGPVQAMAALEDMEEVVEMMDWAEAEGGYLLDFDRQTAICFGSPFFDPGDADEMEIPDDVAAAMHSVNDALDQGPQVFLKSIAHVWKGWKLIWDQCGVDGFAAYLKDRGVGTLVVQPLSHPPTTDAPETFQA